MRAIGWGLALWCVSVPAFAQGVEVRMTRDGFALKFDEAVQVLDNARTDSLVTLSPARPMSCSWTDDAQLDCKFEKPAPLATRFRIVLGNGLQTVQGAPINGKALVAETARPLLSAQIASWNAGLSEIELHSTHDIEVRDAVAVLRLDVDGKRVPVALSKRPRASYESGGTRFDLRLPPTKAGAIVKLVIGPGLKSHDGPLAGRQDETLVLAQVGEPFQLRNAVCAGDEAPIVARVVQSRIALDGCVPGEPMRLQFSRPLDAASIKAFVGTWPTAMHFEESGTEYNYKTYGDLKRGIPARSPGSWIEFTMQAPHASATFAITDVRAEDGAAFAAPIAARASTVAARPSFTGAYDRALLQDPARPVVQVRNLPPDAMDVRGLAVTIENERVATPASGEAARDVVSDVARRALDAGGVALFSLPDNPDPGATMIVAAPDFDVYAVAGGASVLVWANAWDGRSPIADADVELISLAKTGEARTLATGRTASDGTALLQLPRDFERPDDEEHRADWYVRVQSGARRGAARAVLPLTLERFSGTLERGTPATQQWGVADRPLYRAGDRVSWRLWMREGGDGGVRAPPEGTHVKLALSDVDRFRELNSWDVTLDAMGAVARTTTLPVHLPDGRYCIGTSYDAGACFFVGTYRAQDLWMRASAPMRTLRDGDMLSLEIEAGYYSGGVAAGVSIGSVGARVRAMDLGAVHPALDDYQFTEARSGTTYSLRGTETLALQTDAEGRAHARLPVVFEEGAAPPAYGELLLTAEAQINDREGTTSNTVHVPYARFSRYVGLKTVPAWLDADSPVTMEAILATADGKRIDGDKVEVEIAFGKSESELRTVHACRLVAGRASECNFLRRDSGYYRITARSGDAAPVVRDQYIWSRSSDLDKTLTTNLELVGPDVARGASVRVMLKQPLPQAQVLLVAEWNGAVIARRVVQVDSQAQIIDFPTGPRWPHRFFLTAYVRGGQWANVPAGFRNAVKVTSDAVFVKFAPPADKAPVAIAFVPAHAAPAETVRLQLRNDATVPRAITLTVMDDALHALGATYMQGMDPGGKAWVRAGVPFGVLQPMGFDTWNDDPWRWRMPSLAQIARCERIEKEKGRLLCRKDLRRGTERRPINVASVESTSVFTEVDESAIPLARDTTSVPLAAPGFVRYGDDALELNAVEVVGAGAINPIDVASVEDADVAAVPPTPGAPAVVFDEPHAVDVPALALARIRTAFAETALWRTDIVLAPGETRDIDFKVPDNLTRWRAIAWSHDDSDDFAMAEATLEAGLPLEARLQTPVRVYAGDTTRIAANVRQSGTSPTQVDAVLRVQSGEDVDSHAASLSLAPGGQDSFGASLSPASPGNLTLTAAAANADGRDAVSAPLEVASTAIDAQRVQAGWIGDAPVVLALPTLPASATGARMQVSAWRGNSALLHGWTEDLRDYPHRCWEQILSRAVGAALAIERGDPSWPDAQKAVQEALDNAIVFQSQDGQMHYFAGDIGRSDARPNVALTAYTLDAFATLRRLGHAVSDDVERSARQYVSRDFAYRASSVEDRAIAAAAVAPESENKEHAPWKSWGRLRLPARIATARALAREGSPDARAAFAMLLESAPQRGESRVVAGMESWSRWMGSGLREQCSLIRLFGDYPQFAPAQASRQLQAGLSDLYAGGRGHADTQEAAICLMALQEDKAKAAAPIAIDATVGGKTERIALDADENGDATTFDAPRGALTLVARERTDAPIAYLARIDYQEDARQAQSTAIGFAIDRRYEVLRNRAWTPLATAGPVHEGDWIRVSLVVTNARDRAFVAVTDDLPGGLRPTDLSLAGVAGVDMQAIGDEGDGAFSERKLDPRKPKFYAEHLWPGRHEIHYFARVANTGDYLAAPATAELMYGEATRARTAADRIRIADPAPKR